MQTFYREIIQELKKHALDKKALNNLKIELCRKHHIKKIPTDIDILLHAEKKDIPKLKLLKTKPMRTQSGVSVIAIMTKPRKCPHGKCIMCPGGPSSFYGNVPQSYTGKEPASLRAIRNSYDPYLQVMNRLEQYALLGHNFEKIELIIMGGTFPAYLKKYQEEFVKFALKAMNDFSLLFFKKSEFNIEKFRQFFELYTNKNDKDRIKRIHQRLLQQKNKDSTTLEKEQKKNETSKIRCIALCIETRPDFGKLQQGNELLRLGCTRIEIGVQSIYNEILKKIKRGHTAEDSIASIKALKDLGFKISIHYMPGLTDYKKDLAGIKALFSDENYKPDMLKIYPCMVMKGTELYTLWKKNKFTPITTEKAAQLIAEFKSTVPEYCRIQRIQRDIPTTQTVAGVNITNLRQFIHQKYEPKCRCIRCREPKNKKIDFKAEKIIIRKYKASGGTEFFIAAEDTKNDILLGFGRLRFPSESLRKEITEDSALIRELHVYGEAAALGEKGSIQHKGIGKMLMKKAEEIAKQHKKKKLVVISGIGAKEYYRKLGYKKDGPYMIKVFRII